jgi:hypothetical protein
MGYQWFISGKVFSRKMDSLIEDRDRSSNWVMISEYIANHSSPGNRSYNPPSIHGNVLGRSL